MIKFIQLLAVAAFLVLGVTCTDYGYDEYYYYYYDDYEEKPKCTKPNEVFDQCDAPCPERTCDFDPTVVRCAAPPKIGDPACVVGCRCIDGYLRNSQGVCVPKDECPKCKENEIFIDCPDTYCLIKSCTDLGFPLNCTEKPSDGSCPGSPGCVCAPGYARDSKGKCIKTSKCPSCGGDKNATPGCGSNCGKKCSDVGKKRPIRCPPGCRYNGCDCKNGFYYDANKKKCVRPHQCTPTCKLNEIFVDCPAASCQPKTCEELGYPIACPSMTKCPSKPGCICDNGYVRNSKGICVPPDQCPSCGGDENAKPGCGSNCGKKCSDLGKKGPLICPLFCRLNGCDCKEGFYYDANKNKCVLADQCSNS